MLAFVCPHAFAQTSTVFVWEETANSKAWIEYRGEGWRNLRELHYMRRGYVSPEPNEMSRAYWACGHDKILFPTISEHFGASVYGGAAVEARGFESAIDSTILTVGVVVEAKPTGFDALFDFDPSQAKRLIAVMKGICAMVPTINQQPEQIPLAHGDSSIWHFSPNRFRKVGSSITTWISQDPTQMLAGSWRWKPSGDRTYDWKALELALIDHTRGRTMVQARYDCDAGTVLNISAVEYAADGSVKNSFDGGVSTRSVVPGSMGESAWEILCLLE